MNDHDRSPVDARPHIRPGKPSSLPGAGSGMNPRCLVRDSMKRRTAFEGLQVFPQMDSTPSLVESSLDE